MSHPRPPPPLDERWFLELAWLMSDAEILTPEQRKDRLLRRLACANPHNAVEMAFLVDQANAVVLPAP